MYHPPPPENNLPTEAQPHHVMDVDDETSTESEPEAIEARPVAPPPGKASPALEDLSHSELIERVLRAEQERDNWQRSCDRTAKLFVEYRDENHQLLIEKRAHQSIVDTLQAQLDRTMAQLSAANERNAELAGELAQLRADMKGGFPPLARLEALTSEVNAFKVELAASKLRQVNTENESNFFREQYQTASNANYKNKQEVDELQRELELLKKKADARPVLLREMNNDMILKAKEMEIVVLKETLKEREKRVERLERERKERELERDRMLRGVRGNWTTRSGSVPRRTPVGRASPAASPAASRTSSPPTSKEVKGKGS